MRTFIVPVFMNIPLCVDDDSSTTVAMIGNSFCQHLHALKRYTGRVSRRQQTSHRTAAARSRYSGYRPDMGPFIEERIAGWHHGDLKSPGGGLVLVDQNVEERILDVGGTGTVALPLQQVETRNTQHSGTGTARRNRVFLNLLSAKNSSSSTEG